MTPSHASLRSAVAAAIKKGCDRTTINVPHWKMTYPGVTEADVREEWAIALAKVPPGTVELQEEAA